MTVIKHKEQRVGVFIDTQNLYHSARNLYQARVNFGAVLKDAVAGRKLVRAVAYVITTEAGDEKNFFEALTKLGIETKTKDLQIFAGGTKKADWDVGLAVDAIKMAPRLDCVVIGSGDGDLCRSWNIYRLLACKWKWWLSENQLPENCAKRRMI